MICTKNTQKRLDKKNLFLKVLQEIYTLRCITLPNNLWIQYGEIKKEKEKFNFCVVIIKEWNRLSRSGNRKVFRVLHIESPFYARMII